MSLKTTSLITFVVDESHCWPQSLCFSPDGEWLALGTSLGNILVYSTICAEPPRYHLNVDNDIYNAVAVTCIHWHSFQWLDGTLIQQRQGSEAGIVAGFEDGHVRIATKRGFTHIRETKNALECLAVFSNDEHRVASASGGEITIWAYTDSTDIWHRLFHISESPAIRPHLECVIRHVSFTPDGERLLAGYVHHGMWFWNAKTGNRMRQAYTLPATRFGSIDVRFSNSHSPRAIVFNMRDGYDLYPLNGMSTLDANCVDGAPVTIQPAVFDRYGFVVWGTWGTAGRLRAWSIKSGRIVGDFDNEHQVQGLAHTGSHSNKSVLASLGYTGNKTSIKLWHYTAKARVSPAPNANSPTRCNTHCLIALPIAIVLVAWFVWISALREQLAVDSVEVVFLRFEDPF